MDTLSIESFLKNSILKEVEVAIKIRKNIRNILMDIFDKLLLNNL